MRAVILVMSASLLGAFACSPEQEATPPQTQSLSIDRLDTIATPLAWRKAIDTVCQREEPDHLSVFLAELKEIDPAAANTMDIKTHIILEESANDEPEYVCTPEMLEESNKNVQAALTDWTQMKAS